MRHRHILGSVRLFAFEVRDLVWATNAEMSTALLRFASIQRIERKQDPAGLPPERCFITAQAVEGKIGQIGQTQKTPRKLCRRNVFQS